MKALLSPSRLHDLLFKESFQSRLTSLLSSFLSQAKFSAGLNQPKPSETQCSSDFHSCRSGLVRSVGFCTLFFFFFPALNLSEKIAYFVALFICLFLYLQRN